MPGCASAAAPWYGEEATRSALAGSLFGVVALRGPEIVGMGRVVGDGTVFFYLQDIALNATTPDGRGTNTPDGGMQDGGMRVRLVVEVDDFDIAVASHRDHLGMPEELSVGSGHDTRAGAGCASLERHRRTPPTHPPAPIVVGVGRPDLPTR